MLSTTAHNALRAANLLEFFHCVDDVTRVGAFCAAIIILARKEFITAHSSDQIVVDDQQLTVLALDNRPLIFQSPININ